MQEYISLQLISHNKQYQQLIDNIDVFYDTNIDYGLLFDLIQSLQHIVITNEHGEKQFIIPEQIEQFMCCIQKCAIVTYNTALVFHVLRNVLNNKQIIFDLIDGNCFRDVAMLAALCETAMTNKINYNYVRKCSVKCDMICQYKYLYKHAITLMSDHFHDIFENSIKMYGVLTEYIQIKGSIALLDIQLNGMKIDPKQCLYMFEQVKSKYLNVLAMITSDLEYVQVFKKYDDLDKISINKSKLNEILKKEAKRIKLIHNIEIDENFDTTNNFWKYYVKHSEFVRLWTKFKKYRRYYGIVKKLYQRVYINNKTTIHPIYVPLTINGKTSCKNPPIQQFPCKKGYREIFQATPGTIILDIDYNYIELCTLAKICERKIGSSVLAQNIRKNIDLHTYTASMLFGIDYKEFLTWKSSADKNQRDMYMKKRKIAKAINFSVAGGQGVHGLQKYVTNVADIEMTLSDARKFRHKLIYDVYPELGQYMEKFTINNIAKTLRNTPENCLSLLGNTYELKMQFERASIKGTSLKKFNETIGKIKKLCYNPKFYERLEQLEQLNCDPKEIYQELCCADVYTLTGRIRRNVDYTVAFNMPRSAMAADLAKLAMWNLFRSGFHIIAFIHDEVLIELPQDDFLHDNVKKVHKIFNSAMPELSDTIPIRSDSSLMKSWTKN